MRAKSIAIKLAIFITISISFQNNFPPAKIVPGQNLELRKPIYFIIEPSFSIGCPQNIKDYTACMAERLAIFSAGIDDWLKHFTKPSRPKMVILHSANAIPSNTLNFPIHVEIEKDGCMLGNPKTRYGACYKDDSNVSRIVFDEPAEITVPTSAHEIGHVLGLEHRPSDSIMSYRKRNIVQPIDLITLCTQNNTCPPHDTVWCKNSFYDKCRCPSISFEKSEEGGRACE